MAYYALFFGGINYSEPSIPYDVEFFATASEAREQLIQRFLHGRGTVQYWNGPSTPRNVDFPLVEADAHFKLWGIPAGPRPEPVEPDVFLTMTIHANGDITVQ